MQDLKGIDLGLTNVTAIAADERMTVQIDFVSTAALDNDTTVDVYFENPHVGLLGARLGSARADDRDHAELRANARGGQIRVLGFRRGVQLAPTTPVLEIHDAFRRSIVFTFELGSIVVSQIRVLLERQDPANPTPPRRKPRGTPSR